MFQAFTQAVQVWHDPSVIKTVAEAVILAQDIREKSWDEKTGTYQVAQATAAYRAAEQKGVGKEWAALISVWNQRYWNDIQYWALEIIEKDSSS